MDGPLAASQQHACHWLCQLAVFSFQSLAGYVTVISSLLFKVKGFVGIRL